MSDRLFRIDVSKAESLEAEEALASLMADGVIVAVPMDPDQPEFHEAAALLEERVDR